MYIYQDINPGHTAIVVVGSPQSPLVPGCIYVYVYVYTYTDK
jgi:hypothetical protein